MAKRVVITKHGDDIPFLRGILVKSLVRTGMTFEDAYEIAQQVRDSLDDDFEISCDELAGLTANLIEEKHGSSMRVVYETCPSVTTDSVIVSTSTNDIPFSVATLASRLESYGINLGVAFDTAQTVLQQLNADGYRFVPNTDLNILVYRCLKEHHGQEAADVFVSWRAFRDSGKSLVLLIGGVTGVGKSTVSHEICYRLDITQVQSTDLMREIVRTYLSPPVVPMLQHSSFEAWKSIPNTRSKKGFFTKSVPVIEGFLSQLEVLKPALLSSIERAMQEQNHMIIEGIHIVPDEIDLSFAQESMITIPVMLANTSKSALKKQLTRRGKEQTSRPAKRYVENLDNIWALQSFLLKRADKADIPIITNKNIKATVSAVIELISATICKEFKAGDFREEWDEAKLDSEESEANQATAKK